MPRLPSQRAMRLTVCPPAVVKVPPAIRSPFHTVSRDRLHEVLLDFVVHCSGC
jgi:hypothetical protein